MQFSANLSGLLLDDAGKVSADYDAFVDVHIRQGSISDRKTVAANTHQQTKYSPPSATLSWRNSEQGIHAC